jgi:hypothetical protein
MSVDDAITSRIDYPALYLSHMRKMIERIDHDLAELERVIPYCNIPERRANMVKLRALFDEISASILDASSVVGDHVKGLDEYLARTSGPPKASR